LGCAPRRRIGVNIPPQMLSRAAQTIAPREQSDVAIRRHVFFPCTVSVTNRGACCTAAIGPLRPFSSTKPPPARFTSRNCRTSTLHGYALARVVAAIFHVRQSPTCASVRHGFK
jgi:hypothetical protein